MQGILQLDVLCLQHFLQNRRLKGLTGVYRETRGWPRGCLRDGDVRFPAGNFHRILVPDLAGPSFQTETAAPSVVDPAELRLAVCLSRRYDPIACPFGN